MGVTTGTSVDTSPEYDEEMYERVTWMLPNLRTSMLRYRIHECVTMGEVQAWVAVYNELSDQLPPAKEGLIEEIQQQADRVREGRTWEGRRD